MNEHVHKQFAALLNSFARVFEPNDRDPGDEQPDDFIPPKPDGNGVVA